MQVSSNSHRPLTPVPLPLAKGRRLEQQQKPLATLWVYKNAAVFGGSMFVLTKRQNNDQQAPIHLIIICRFMAVEGWWWFGEWWRPLPWKLYEGLVDFLSTAGASFPKFLRNQQFLTRNQHKNSEKWCVPAHVYVDVFGTVSVHPCKKNTTDASHSIRELPLRNIAFARSARCKPLVVGEHSS